MAWAAAWLAGQFQARVRRDTATVFAAEHVALLVALASGAVLLASDSARLGTARWLGLKLGLVVFLIVPLEGFHAFVCHVWLPQARRMTGVLAERRIERGIGMEEMIRTLGIPLLGTAVPLIVWLSMRKPF